MFRFPRAIFLLALLLPLSARVADAAGPAPAADEVQRDYLVELSALFLRADRVIVTEHSFEYDAWQGGKSLLPQEVVYATRTLDTAQRTAFAQELRKVDRSPVDYYTFCEFEPHHRVQLYERDTLVGTIEVCFGCGGVSWDGAPEPPPPALVGAFFRLVTRVGLEPERDWRTLAKEHLRSTQETSKP